MISKRVNFLLYGLLAVFILCCVFGFLYYLEQGGKRLGSQLHYLDLGGHRKTNGIFYCKDFDCDAATWLIPSDERRSANGEFAEPVQALNNNQQWVIVKTHRLDDDQDYYYIISKDYNLGGLWGTAPDNIDSVLKAHITGPMDLETFNTDVKKWKIDLKFDHQVD